MLRGHPDVGEIYEIDRAWQQINVVNRLQHEVQLLLSLRRRRYDLIVHLTDHARGMWLSRFLRPRFSVAPDVRKNRFYRSSFTHLFPVIGGNRRHTVEINLDALRRLGIYPGVSERKLKFVPGDRANEEVDRRLGNLGLGRSEFFLIHPGSRWFFKSWPCEKVAGLCDYLTSRGRRVVLVCGPDPLERQLLAWVTSNTDEPPISFPGNLSIRELAALIGKARIFVGMDSAPMHIAAAMGTPTIALFGPSGEIEWGPWQVTHRVVTSSHPCRPCGRDGCGGGKRSECLEEIDLKKVVLSIEELLGENV